MTSNEVLSMYENIAGLTGKMAMAAQSGDWTGFDSLQAQCAVQASATATGVPALEGAKRLRALFLRLREMDGQTKRRPKAPRCYGRAV